MFERGKENLVHEICYHKFRISHEETDLHLTFKLTLFKMEFSPLTIRHATLSK